MLFLSFFYLFIYLYTETYNSETGAFDLLPYRPGRVNTTSLFISLTLKLLLFNNKKNEMKREGLWKFCTFHATIPGCCRDRRRQHLASCISPKKEGLFYLLSYFIIRGRCQQCVSFDSFSSSLISKQLAGGKKRREKVIRPPYKGAPCTSRMRTLLRRALRRRRKLSLCFYQRYSFYITHGT